jgi:hypothetical protein
MLIELHLKKNVFALLNWKVTYYIGLFADLHEGGFECNVQGFFVDTILVSIGKHDVAMNLWNCKVHESHCCDYRKRKKLNKNYDRQENFGHVS